jgi:hypothetical protein
MLPIKSKVINYSFIILFSLSENVPDWNTEIGGLNLVKEQVEEIFGVT